MTMKILCLGDSLAYGFAMPRGQVWTALCAAQTGAELVNLAVNGNTTGGMLAMLPRAMETHSPDLVFLMGGVNDILYGGDLPGAKANMGGMAHLVTAFGAVPMFGIPISPRYPVRQDWAALFPDNTKLLCTEYNGWLRKFAHTFHLPVIDFSDEFSRRADQRGYPVDVCYLVDGLHPSRIGHELMAEIAAEAISPFLQKRMVKRG